MDKIAEMIKKSKKAAVIGHIDEDSDSFGSTLAMLTMLKNNGNDAVLFLSKEPERRLRFLSEDYTFFDENTNTDEFDLLICLDTATKERLGKRIALLERVNTSINIDHHYTNTMYADYNRVDGSMSSASEMVYDLFVEMGAEITSEIAKYLYVGIMGDTGCLKYSSASPKTVTVISKLMETGIDHADICRRMFDTESIEVIKLKAYLMNNIESYYDSKVSIIAIDDEVFDKYGVDENDCGDIVNIARSVEGTQIAVSVRKTSEKIKISFRSNGEYNVSDIASNFGGGGHVMAAGASVGICDINEIKEKIVKVIGEYING